MYTIETLRLRLCPMSEEYIDDLVQMWRDPDVMRYLPTGKPRPLSDSRQELDYMIEHWKEFGFGIWRISIKNMQPFVGYCGLQHLREQPGVSLPKLEDRREVEAQVGVVRDLWNKGIGFEAAKAAIRFGFDTLGLTQIIAATHPSNFVSRRILEKLGMQEDPSHHYYTGCPHFVLYCRNYTSDNAIYNVEVLY